VTSHDDLVVWSRFSPRIGRSLAFRRPWSASTWLLAYTVHFPLADIQPGDLLSYGPGGSDHEAMYFGGSSMVEATHTGDFVRIRIGGGLVVGRIQWVLVNHALVILRRRPLPYKGGSE
jgi:cell wall-associated NlpC family hydrolase